MPALLFAFKSGDEIGNNANYGKTKEHARPDDPKIVGRSAAGINTVGLKKEACNEILKSGDYLFEIGETALVMP